MFTEVFSGTVSRSAGRSYGIFQSSKPIFRCHGRLGECLSLSLLCVSVHPGLSGLELIYLCMDFKIFCHIVFKMLLRCMCVSASVPVSIWLDLLGPGSVFTHNSQERSLFLHHFVNLNVTQFLIG